MNFIPISFTTVLATLRPQGKQVRHIGSTWSLAMFISLLFFFGGKAEAIPTYARQYQLSCSSCHSPVPKLNSFGEAFAANGYQIKDLPDQNVKVETGDSSLALMKELPIAVRLDGFSRIQPSENQKTDIEWPMIMKLFSSGQIKTDISYFFYFLMNEGGNITGVEDAFLYFNNLFGKPFDITAGQFQVADIIFKRELRPTFEDYQIYQIRPGQTKADLTYDRGIILNYTLPSKTDLYFSIVNGSGIGPSNNGFYDSDPYKNIIARIAQNIIPDVSVGTLGYFGKESNNDAINTFQMFGADASLSLNQFELIGQYLYRHDANPFFISKDSTINSYGGFVQLMYAPNGNTSDWYAFLLYNNDRSDIEELKYQSLAGNFSYMVSRNFKLTAEYGYDIERLKHSLTVGFMTAF